MPVSWWGLWLITIDQAPLATVGLPPPTTHPADVSGFRLTGRYLNAPVSPEYQGEQPIFSPGHREGSARRHDLV